MRQQTTTKLIAMALALVLTSLPVHRLWAEDAIETAGMAVGQTAGNIVFVPIKAIAVSVGLLGGALSFILSGGNVDLSKQIWQDTTEDPYLITPEVARKAIGTRPELSEK